MSEYILLSFDVFKKARWVADSVDTDQTPRFAASGLCLRC